MTNRRGTAQAQRGSLGAELGRGGEGTIYEVPNRPDLVAKLWKTPSDAKARKLDALLRSRPKIPTQAENKIRMAWPQQALYDSRRQTIGFAMPRAERGEYREFVRYSIPSARAELENEFGVSIGERDLLGIARNVAETFELVHANFCLIGDVNHTNFLVNPDTSVFLIDVDSLQVSDRVAGETYKCEVGTPDFTPPRLMGKRLSEIYRAPDDDHFGLAVLIFQLLMGGNHPYDPVDSAGTSASGNARLENIKRGYSPLYRHSRRSCRSVDNRKQTSESRGARGNTTQDSRRHRGRFRHELYGAHRPPRDGVARVEFQAARPVQTRLPERRCERRLQPPNAARVD